MPPQPLFLFSLVKVIKVPIKAGWAQGPASNSENSSDMSSVEPPKYYRPGSHAANAITVGRFWAFVFLPEITMKPDATYQN